MKVAIYARVSTEERSEENQVSALQQLAAARGYDVYEVYTDVGSAWQHADQTNLRRLVEDGRCGRFTKVLVWSLDRLTRGGPGKIFPLMEKLGQYNIMVVSLQESWTEVPGEMYDLLLAIASWFANWESRRISERTKAGLARARAQGKKLGRPRKKR